MITTKRGDFATFASLRRAYVASREGNHLGLDKYSQAHPFHRDRLHLSQLGVCPRKQMFDILGTEPKYQTQNRIDNDSLMWTIGYLVHYLSYAAFDWGGILLDFESPIQGLPEPWVGRHDALLDLGEEYLWSGKTTRPNAFKGNYRYTFPKLPHKLQEGGYLNYIGAKGSIIEYIDRGGTNSPLTYYVRAKDVLGPAANYMNLISDFYAALPELPDPRPRELVPHYRKRNNVNVYDLDSITSEYCWECAWCPYLYAHEDKRAKSWQTAESSPCKPDMSPPEQVARRSGGSWSFGSDEALYLYESQLKSYEVEDEE